MSGPEAGRPRWGLCEVIKGCEEGDRATPADPGVTPVSPWALGSLVKSDNHRFTPLLSPLVRALDQLSGTQVIDQEIGGRGGGRVAMAAEGAGAGPGLLLKEEGVVPLHRSPGPASVGLPGRPFLLI